MCRVAPFVGAWIEILRLMLFPVVPVQSLRSSERGLKLTLSVRDNSCSIVAPFVGAWIEIRRYNSAFIVPLSLRSSERGLK